jgi:hypothetical protein
MWKTGQQVAAENKLLSAKITNAETAEKLPKARKTPARRYGYRGAIQAVSPSEPSLEP